MRKILIPLIVVLPMTGFMVYQARLVTPVVCEEPKVRPLGEIPGYSRSSLPISEAEAKVLPKDTRIEKCVYSDRASRSFQVTMVFSGAVGRTAIHRPELCLPSQGFQMRSPRNLRTGKVGWRCLSLAYQDNPPYLFAYTFLNQDGLCTSSHFYRILRDVLDRSFLQRIDRWVMVTVCASVTSDAEFADFLRKLDLEVRP